MKALDPLFVRGRFPAPLWEWAFFENAGGVYVPNSVIERITAYMSQCQVQPGSNFPLAAKAQDRMNTGHARMAAMIGADEDEVVIGPSTSINAYVLAQALRPLWSDGDKALARHYGVVRTDLQPYASRVTVILDARGAIIERLPNDALSPAPADHAQAALDVLNRMAAAKP